MLDVCCACKCGKQHKQVDLFIYFIHSEISGLLHNFFIFPLLTIAQTWCKRLASKSGTARSDLDSTLKTTSLYIHHCSMQMLKEQSEGSKGMCRHAFSETNIYKVTYDLKTN